MSKRAKLLTTMCSLVVALCAFAFGVFAATKITYDMANSVTYHIKDALVKVTRTVEYLTPTELNIPSTKTTVVSDTTGKTWTNASTMTFQTYDENTGVWKDPQVSGDITYTNNTIADKINANFNNGYVYKVTVKISSIASTGVKVTYTIPETTRNNAYITAGDCTLTSGQTVTTERYLTYYMGILDLTTSIGTDIAFETISLSIENADIQQEGYTITFDSNGNTLLKHQDGPETIYQNGATSFSITTTELTEFPVAYSEYHAEYTENIADITRNYVWFFDKAYTQKVVLPYTPTSNVTLYGRPEYNIMSYDIASLPTSLSISVNGMEILKIKDKQFFDDIFEVDENGHYWANANGVGGTPFSEGNYSGTFYNQNIDTFEFTPYSYSLVCFSYNFSYAGMDYNYMGVNCELSDIYGTGMLTMIFRDSSNIKFMFLEDVDMRLELVTENGETISCNYEWIVLD